MKTKILDNHRIIAFVLLGIFLALYTADYLLLKN